MADLTDKQRKFALRYLANGHNATEAAVYAGYSAKTAGQMGYENLKKPEIQSFIAQELQSQASAVADEHAQLELSARRVLEETMVVGYSDVADFFNEDGTLKKVTEMPAELRRAVAGVEVDEIWGMAPLKNDDGTPVVNTKGDPVMAKQIIGYTRKLKLWPKVNALELLGKNLKLWTEVIETRTKNMTQEQLAKRAADLVNGALARAKTPA